MCTAKEGDLRAGGTLGPFQLLILINARSHHRRGECANAEGAPRPRRHFQSHDRRQQSREGSGWVGWRQLVPLLRRRRNEQEPRLFPLSSLGGGWTDGERDKKLRRVINYVQVRFILFYSAPPFERASEALYRRYSSSVFLACITERFSQHFTFFARPHSIYSAGNEDDTDSISGNVDSSEAHSDPFSSRITGGAATESPQSASTTLHDENCGPMSAPPPRPSPT